MQAISSNSPDQRIDLILTHLAAGKRREQIAAELSYKSYKGLDMFMKRNKFIWDQKRNYYFPVSEQEPKKDQSGISWLHRPDTRTASVLSLLNQGLDLKEVADQLRFTDHRELALYMKSKGYIWSEEDATYHFKNQNFTPASSNAIQSDTIATHHQILHTEPTQAPGSLINFLEQNKDILYQIVSSHLQAAQLPRYTIPGVYITKSMSMNYGMDMLIRSYSQDKNVSQKDIIEIALVDFFCKYGYLQEVNTLLGKPQST